MTTPLAPDAFVALLRTEGERHYHHRHPFHERMHRGKLEKEELREWVRNRYYYQTRIPVKDALLLSKSEDPAFRRAWARRLSDQDGTHGTEGGLATFRRLGHALGLDDASMARHEGVLPGVRFCCDAYVDSVRRSPLVEAVASSLTEFFAPDLMAARVEAWEAFYPYVPKEALAYFRSRVPRARHDANEALVFVLAQATTRAEQDRCVRALVTKAEILWHLLDCLEASLGRAPAGRP